MPDLLCKNSDDSSSKWYSCKQEEACFGAGIIYRVDYEGSETVRNAAMERLDLVCSSNAFVGLIGSSYFIGWVSATITVPFIGDYYGRKLPYLLGLFCRLLGIALSMLSKNLLLLYIGHFLVGYAFTLSCSSAFYYAVELVPKNTARFVPPVFQVLDSLFHIVPALFLWASRDMNTIYYCMFGTIALGFAVIAVIPESPAYLLKKRRYRELNEALRRIAKFNCSPNN